jgi:uncharacterized membrane-anchored protein
MLMDNVVTAIAIGFFAFVTVIVAKLMAITVHLAMKHGASVVRGHRNRLE